jgi:hypothetical protein
MAIPWNTPLLKLEKKNHLPEDKVAPFLSLGAKTTSARGASSGSTSSHANVLRISIPLLFVTACGQFHDQADNVKR